MHCPRTAIFSLKWRGRSFCIWASTGGKPSKTGHLHPFRLAGMECAWERTNSPANASSISPDTLAVSLNGRATTIIYGLPFTILPRPSTTQTLESSKERRRFRHSAPRLSSISDAWGRLNVVTPFHHLSGGQPPSPLARCRAHYGILFGFCYSNRVVLGEPAENLSGPSATTEANHLNSPLAISSIALR